MTPISPSCGYKVTMTRQSPRRPLNHPWLLGAGLTPEGRVVLAGEDARNMLLHEHEVALLLAELNQQYIAFANLPGCYEVGEREHDIALYGSLERARAILGVCPFAKEELLGPLRVAQYETTAPDGQHSS